MWQEHGQSALAQPLLLATIQIRVNDDLRAVEEISKLCFPDRQSIGRLERHAVFKPKNGKLTQARVGDLW